VTGRNACMSPFVGGDTIFVAEDRNAT